MTIENESITLENSPKRKKATGFITELVIYLILIFACIYVVPEYVLQRTVVQGESMENTLYTSESLLVEKLTKHFQNPKRYEIIVFTPHSDPDEHYVKRVIGLPGETIQIIDNDIYINDEKIPDTHHKDGNMYGNGIAKEKIKLGDNEYFVLGDNREVSLDSRDASVGPVKAEQIEGKVILRIWPLNKLGIP